MKKPLLLIPFLLGACVAQQPDTSVEAGKAAYQTECAACHGADGRGAGDFGVELFTIPPDLTTLSAQNGGDFPRDYVMSVIDGYDRSHAFSAAMPEFGVLDLGPTVIVEEDGVGTPVPATLLALANYLETIQE
ncbi:c-type cytochrome [Salibaculum griseiflavum]|jgi:mono/diheme cytochrome c family protein|uniref:Cytochrome C n=1 Tax=Salibaculum griseiflavum TaxID=1914409 RepID=A0A2V1P2I6_9RHOB|nr:cytochrome c [Salibaculum griseiflavum]PWG15980.1 cytochrome C [Salibaculum griseiflavum]